MSINTKSSITIPILTLLFLLCAPILCLAEEESAFFRGFNYLRNKQYSRAIRQFELTIKRNPTYLPTYSNLAECYERQNKYDESKEVWKKYVKYAKFYKPAGQKHIELLDKIKEAKSILADVLKENVVEDTGIMQELAITDTPKDSITEKDAWEMAEPLLIDVANDQYPMSVICLQAREILGKYYFKNKLYKEAADAYKKVLRFYSRDITQEILYNYAISLGHIKEYEDSVKMFIQITENCPIAGVEEKKEFRENVMASYLGMANEIAGTEETEDMLKAIEMYQKIEQYYSDTKACDVARKNIMQVEKMLAKRFEREGDELYVEKDYSEAMKQYRNIIDNCPGSPRYQNAKKKYETLQKLEHDYHRLAFKSFARGDGQKCKDIYTELLDQFPDGQYASRAHQFIGYCYASEGKFAKAINELVKVARLYPESEEADDALERAGVYLRYAIKDKKKALRVFSYLLEKYPDSNSASSSLYFMGEIYLEEKQYQQAYISFQKLRKNFPEDELARRARFQIAKIKYEVKKEKKK